VGAVTGVSAGGGGDNRTQLEVRVQGAVVVEKMDGAVDGLGSGAGKKPVSGVYAGLVGGNKKGKVDGELAMDANLELTLIDLGREDGDRRCDWKKRIPRWKSGDEGGKGGEQADRSTALIPLCQDPDGSLTINRWKRGKLEHSGLRSINCRK
jgi:hypothetical protein